MPLQDGAAAEVIVDWKQTVIEHLSDRVKSAKKWFVSSVNRLPGVCLIFLPSWSGTCGAVVSWEQTRSSGHVGSGS